LFVLEGAEEGAAEKRGDKEGREWKIKIKRGGRGERRERREYLLMAGIAILGRFIRWALRRLCHTAP
jgi:hypothetical protein